MLIIKKVLLDSSFVKEVSLSRQSNEITLSEKEETLFIKEYIERMNSGIGKGKSAIIEII